MRGVFDVITKIYRSFDLLFGFQCKRVRQAAISGTWEISYEPTFGEPAPDDTFIVTFRQNGARVKSTVTSNGGSVRGRVRGDNVALSVVIPDPPLFVYSAELIGTVTSVNNGVPTVIEGFWLETVSFARLRNVVNFRFGNFRATRID